MLKAKRDDERNTSSAWTWPLNLQLCLYVVSKHQKTGRWSKLLKYLCSEGGTSWPTPKGLPVQNPASDSADADALSPEKRLAVNYENKLNKNRSSSHACISSIYLARASPQCAKVPRRREWISVSIKDEAFLWRDWYQNTQVSPLSLKIDRAYITKSRRCIYSLHTMVCHFVECQRFFFPFCHSLCLLATQS